MISQLQSYLQQDEIRFPEGFDLAALLLYSLTGALLAMRRGYDLIGVFILALVVGAGGGLIRDGLFLQQGPPMLTRNWRLLPAVLGACLIGWFVHHWVFRMHKVVAVLDAVGLSVLSMVGRFPLGSKSGLIQPRFRTAAVRIQPGNVSTPWLPNLRRN